MWLFEAAAPICSGRKNMVNCPVCDAVMDVEEDELDEGDEFTCEECGAEVAVVGTDPLEIEPLSDTDDDDEDEDDDEDLDEDEEDEDADEEDEDGEDWK
jgi:alpha-aminoadipate/glutamate carrier protein LysW